MRCEDFAGKLVGRDKYSSVLTVFLKQVIVGTQPDKQLIKPNTAVLGFSLD